MKRFGSLATTGLPQAMPSATYDLANRLTNWNGTPLSYNANGNMLGDGANSYAWNARNQLAALTGADLGVFMYDGLGRRAAKSIDGVTTQYLHDGLNPVQELSSTGVATANLLTGLGIDELFMRTDSAGSRSYLTDILGSAVALTDPNGAIATTYSYEPLGRASVGGAASTNRFQFTGRENDGTGLLYYRARYYRSALQRFTAQDPIGFASGVTNLYVYVGGNPLGFIDPLGLTAGDRFPTIDDAALDALQGANARTAQTGNEAYGGIYRDGDKACPYTYDGPFDSGPVGGWVDFPSLPSGIYHTHPGGTGAFSGDDIRIARRLGGPNYIIAPDGRMFKYDPSTDDTSPITPRHPRRCGC